jgi:uncharacterized protein YtpQ (UPF0354 family)
MVKRGALVVLVVLASCGGDQALSQMQFSELVSERALEEFPSLTVRHVDERGFEYQLPDGQEGRVVVGDEYVEYTRRPEALDEIVGSLVGLLASHREQLPYQQDRERIVSSIMPELRAPSFLADAEVRAGRALLHEQHPSGLLVFYVVDQPPSYSYMAEAALERLSLTPQQVSSIAMSNLARRTGEGRFEVEQTPDGPIAVARSRDGYDASRLISPTLMLALYRELGSATTVVAIPHRDLLIAAPADRPALVERVRAQARAEFEAAASPITTALYLVSRDGVRPFES